MWRELFQQRRMTGGLYFGPPAWSPDTLIDHTTPPTLSAVPPVLPTTREELLTFVRTAGIRATSAHSPALLPQLETLSARSIRTLIVNMLPLQPEFALSRAVAHLLAIDFFFALDLLDSVIKPRDTMIVVDRHDRAIRRSLRRASRVQGKRRLRFKCLLNRYPQGNATVLLRRLFNKKLPVGAPPTLANRLIVDPITLWALGRYIRTGHTFDRRPVQLFLQDESPRVIMAVLGETIETCLTRHAVDTRHRQLIVNGMLAGHAATPTALIASDTESLSIRDVPITEWPAPCISCGWCVDHCPTALNPVELLSLAESGKEESPAATEAVHCIGCGLCSYVCPTRLPLTPNIVKLRNTLVAPEETS